VRDEGAATHVGRVGVPGPDAELLSETLYTTSVNISALIPALESLLLHDHYHKKSYGSTERCKPNS
jgi:hypothetical protein